jgi:hypothetical protein
MRGVKTLYTKEIKSDEIVEIKIWQVPKSKNNTQGAIRFQSVRLIPLARQKPIK